MHRSRGQGDVGEAWLPPQLGHNDRLDRVLVSFDWESIERLVRGLHASPTGRPSWAPLTMVKALLLQQWYGLSDPGLEEALSDRLSFRRFVGLGLDEGQPDHSVISRFRKALREAGLDAALFEEVERQLQARRLILKRGTLMDATVVSAAVKKPPAPAGRGSDTDPDADWTRKGGKSWFGYKAHVGVDEGSGLIRSVITTPANVNDTTPADALILGDEKAVWADAAYHTHAREAALKARGVKARLMRRPNKHHPKLPPRLARYNRLIARRRAAVETTFATLKNRMRLTRIRYVGLAKAAAQVLLAAVAFNLRRWARLAPA